MRLRWKPCLVSALSILLISEARAAPQEAVLAKTRLMSRLLPDKCGDMNEIGEA